VAAFLPELLTRLALLLFVVLNAVTGIRLLLLARRTRELPELALGLGHLLGGSLGWALVLFGYFVVTQLNAPRIGLVVIVAGLFCLNFAIVAIGFFSWRVFNRDSKALGIVFALLVVVLATDFVHNGLITHVFAPPTNTFWYWPGCLGRTGTWFWMSIVTFRYYRKLRLRLPLGLADPVTANRMFLFFLAGAFIVLFAVVVSGASLLDVWSRHPQLVNGISSFLGIPSAVCSTLAFVPPKRYTDWIARRTPAVAE
jgi:hypothetical protein